MSTRTMNHELEDLIARMCDSGITYDEAIAFARKAYLKHVMLANKGNQCRAAKQIGLHRNSLSRRLKEAQLDPKTGSLSQTRSLAKRVPPASTIDSRARSENQQRGREAASLRTRLVPSTAEELMSLASRPVRGRLIG